MASYEWLDQGDVFNKRWGPDSLIPRNGYYWQLWNPYVSVHAKIIRGRPYPLKRKRKKGKMWLFSLQRERKIYPIIFCIDRWNFNTISKWEDEDRVKIRYPSHGRTCCSSEILFEKDARSKVQNCSVANQRSLIYCCVEVFTGKLDGWLKIPVDELSVPGNS